MSSPSQTAYILIGNKSKLDSIRRNELEEGQLMEGQCYSWNSWLWRITDDVEVTHMVYNIISKWKDFCREYKHLWEPKLDHTTVCLFIFVDDSQVNIRRFEVCKT